jgi:hypothetical protein
MRKSTPFSKIKKLLLPKKAPPGPPKATSPGIKLVSKDNPEFNRALDEALHRNLPFDDIGEEYTFKAGFGEGFNAGFNAGLKYAKSILDSIT